MKILNVYTAKKGGPGTRMGNISRFRDAFQKAYDHKLELRQVRARPQLAGRKSKLKISESDAEALKKPGRCSKPPKRDSRPGYARGHWKEEPLLISTATEQMKWPSCLN